VKRVYRKRRLLQNCERSPYHDESGPVKSGALLKGKGRGGRTTSLKQRRWSTCANKKQLPGYEKTQKMREEGRRDTGTIERPQHVNKRGRPSVWGKQGGAEKSLWTAPICANFVPAGDSTQKDEIPSRGDKITKSGDEERADTLP